VPSAIIGESNEYFKLLHGGQGRTKSSLRWTTGFVLFPLPFDHAGFVAVSAMEGAGAWRAGEKQTNVTARDVTGWPAADLAWPRPSAQPSGPAAGRIGH
jgi:hypothetical protein